MKNYQIGMLKHKLHNNKVFMTIVSTKISKAFQTVVPSEFRKKYNIRPEDIIEWIDSEDGIKLNIRKKVTDEDITGSLTGNFKYNSVKLKKMHNKGIKIAKGDLK